MVKPFHCDYPNHREKHHDEELRSPRCQFRLGRGQPHELGYLLEDMVYSNNDVQVKDDGIVNAKIERQTPDK